MTTISELSIDRIETFCKQESNTYEHVDYLEHVAQLQGTSSRWRGSTAVDAAFRAAMVRWAMNLADYCEYSDETIASAVACVDAFVSTEDGFPTLFDRNEFQLVVMVSVYMMAKIYERQMLDPLSLSKLSLGAHGVDAIEAMERRILRGLRWNVNPPTSVAFASLLLDLIPDDVLTNKSEILAAANHQLRMTFEEYDLNVYNKPSSLAASAVLNALQESNENFFCNEDVVSHMESLVLLIVSKSHIHAEDYVTNLRLCLRKLAFDEEPLLTDCITPRCKSPMAPSSPTSTAMIEDEPPHEIPYHSRSPRMITYGVV